jgi:hypothetical protein
LLVDLTAHETHKNIMEDSNMNKKPLVSEMFEELIQMGHIEAQSEIIDFTFPGALISVPSVTVYNTPELPIRFGAHSNAKLEQHTTGNSSSSSNAD